ncbi:MAG: sulfatase [Verrucomicrobiota bacterium]
MKSLTIPLLAIGLLLTVTQAEEQRPNVLLIAIDDLNDWVGCLNGHPQARTPHIDALAKRGTLFTNAHCQSPICGPSRASFLSGRYPHETGLYNQPRSKMGKMSDDRENFKDQLLTEYFSQHGYQTIGAGKITHGYKLSDAVDKAGPDGGPGPKPTGPRPPNDTRFNFRPDYSEPFTGTQTDWGAFPDRDDQMPDHQTADWIVKEIEQLDGDKPFFIAAGFNRPHVPFYVPQKWFDLFPLNSIQLPTIQPNDLDDVPATGIALHELPRYPQAEWLAANQNDQLKKCTQAYLACTHFVDAQVGRVVDAIDQSPFAKNTIIVLLSDHGYHIGEKGRVSKHSLWEESTRVPMVVIAPGYPSHKTSDQPTGLIDLYPTLIDLCNLPVRKQNSGLSLVPLLNGKSDAETKWRHSILTNYGRGNYSLRSKRWRFTRYADGSEELYDHQKDPNEWTNLLKVELNDEASHALDVFRSELPEQQAAYHYSVGKGAVNAWFEKHYQTAPFQTL